jgi:hypothetical protein
MPFSDQIAAYPDVAELLDKALTSEKGLKLTFSTDAEATINAGRMNHYRSRLRRENAKTFPPGDHRHNTTPYEGLMIKRRGNIIMIEKLSMERFNLEELK